MKYEMGNKMSYDQVPKSTLGEQRLREIYYTAIV